MSIAQRCSGVLERWSRERRERDPIQAGVLKRCADLIERQERELEALRKTHEAAYVVELARDDRNFARRVGGIRKLQRELSNAVLDAEDVLLAQDCRDNPN